MFNQDDDVLRRRLQAAEAARRRAVQEAKAASAEVKELKEFKRRSELSVSSSKRAFSSATANTHQQQPCSATAHGSSASTLSSVSVVSRLFRQISRMMP
jgi:hypothetical protein